MISVKEEDSNAKSSSLGQDLCFIANLVCSKTSFKIPKFENLKTHPVTTNQAVVLNWSRESGTLKVSVVNRLAR